MSVIEKLSDRGGLVYELIKMIMVNIGPMNVKQMQWELCKLGVYVKAPLLLQALSVMKEKKLIGKPDEEKDTKEEDSQAEASEAGAVTPAIVQP